MVESYGHIIGMPHITGCGIVLLLWFIVELDHYIVIAVLRIQPIFIAILWVTNHKIIRSIAIVYLPHNGLSGYFRIGYINP